MRANATATKERRVYNPVIGKYYEVRRKSSKYEKNGQIKGLWEANKNEQ